MDKPERETGLTLQPAVHFRFQNIILQFRGRFEPEHAERAGRKAFDITPEQLFSAFRTNQPPIPAEHIGIFKTPKFQNRFFSLG